MARTNEYQSKGGEFTKLSDALKSIDELMEEVKQAKEGDQDSPEKKKGFRQIVSELQSEVGDAVAAGMQSWSELELDPLYTFSSEDIDIDRYSRSIKFIHPVYEHVWLTEAGGRNVAQEMIPFLDYQISFNAEDNQLDVSIVYLDAKLNLPEFKSSVDAATVDLQILKEDAMRVETVTGNAEAAIQSLNNTLKSYCENHSIEMDINEEHVEWAESDEDKVVRMQDRAEAAKAERERIQWETDQKKLEAEMFGDKKDTKSSVAAKAKPKKDEVKSDATPKKVANKKSNDNRDDDNDDDNDQTEVTSSRLEEIARINSQQQPKDTPEKVAAASGVAPAPPKAAPPKKAGPPATKVSVPPPLPPK